MINVKPIRQIHTMGHGGNSLNISEYEKYLDDVRRDVTETKQYYPLLKRTIFPYSEPCPITLVVIAVSKSFMEKTGVSKEYLTTQNSRAIEVIIPYDYKQRGCLIYGGDWIDETKLTEAEKHFNGKRKDGSYLLCVGVPASFRKYSNVLLENIKTAERMLNAYDLLLSGITNNLELIAYSHGKKGEIEYEKRNKRNIATGKK